MPDKLWIFAYGSLIFRPGIPFVERRIGRVAGYARRFWQGSVDHRGVPGAPGRVVTLAEEPRARCWGVAYRVAAEHADAVLGELDRREQGGYDRLWLDVHFEPRSTAIGEARSAAADGDGDGAGSARALVYVALPHNRNFLGEAPLTQIVEQVRTARGPSGANLDYALGLARALRELGLDDAHVFELEASLLGARRHH